MDMFGFMGSSVSKFEKRFLNSKSTGMTIEGFEKNHLKNVVHAYYMCQDATDLSFRKYERIAMEKAGTEEGDQATLSAGFLVGINDAIHDPNYEFNVFADLKRKQRDGWAYLIGDEQRNIVGAVETLYEYALARKLNPSDVLSKFPRDEFEREFAAFEQKQSQKDA